MTVGDDESQEPDDATESHGGGGTDIIGLARIAGKSIFRTVESVGNRTTESVGGLARDIVSGKPVTGIIDDSVAQIRSAAAGLLGQEDNGVDREALHGTTPEELRAVGARLLYQSWDPDNEPRDTHPAFKSILQSLTPDEARVLRFLGVAGPQPSMDLRTKTPFQVGSERLASGINLICEMAGCSWPDRNQHYLANLNRLGLVRFSEEPVADFRRYSLLTGQPRALDVYHMGRKIQPVFRSIYLSAFGTQFTETCIPMEGYDAGGWATQPDNDVIHGKGPRWLRPKAKRSNSGV